MKNKDKGFTLIEIMIVIFLISIISYAVYSIYINALRSNKIEQDFLDMQQNLRASLYVASRDIRMAAYSGEAPFIRNVGITVATSTSLTFTMVNDLDGIDNDGDDEVDGADTNGGDISTIVYSLADADDTDTIAMEFCRQVDSGALQEIASNIQAIEFFYTYSDGSTSNRTPSAAQLSGNLIDSIQITLLARGDVIDPKLGGQNISYGPRPGNYTWNFTDNRHRQMISTRIFCRNIN